MTDLTNGLLSLLSGDLSLRWIITLLHFLWQGTVVCLVAASVGSLMRNASASMRHAFFSAALLSLPICVAVTFALVRVPNELQTATLPLLVSVEPIDARQEAIPQTSLLPGPPGSVAASQRGEKLLDQKSDVDRLAISNTPVETQDATSGKFLRSLSPFATWAFVAYAFGVGYLLLRLAVALWGGQRLRANSKLLTDSVLLESIQVQVIRIGLRIVPVVAYCERVTVPTVIGVLRPMILLPGSLLTGLSTEELTAILGHELAHIRRHDLWMNLLQRLIESLLFFHPVVWWLSRRVSAEREVCCDDLVLRAGHTPMSYAGALLRMAELCVLARQPQLASLSVGGRGAAELEHRIERLMQVNERSKLRLTRTGVMILFALLITSVATPAIVSALAQQTEVAATNDPNDPNDPNDAKPEDEPMRGIFSPEPVWQTKLKAGEAAGEMSRISPVVVGGNRVLTLTRDFELVTGNELKPSITQPVEKDEFGSSLTPIFRRISSDRAYVLEVSNRDPGNTWPSPSFEMRVFRAADGKQVGRNIVSDGFFGHGCAAEVESRGNFVLLGDFKRVRMYRVETGEVEKTLPVPIKGVDAVAFSPDQEWLVVSDQNDLHFWRWRDQAPVKTIHAERKIDCLTFTPDGQYLAEGPDSGVDIQIRDMRTLETIASLKDEADSPLMVSSMDISPNGRFLVAHNEVSVDQNKLTIPHRVHVWDLKTRQPVFQVATGEWVRNVAFSDDGRRIVGEFSGAAHGALLAGWKLPDDVLDRRVEPETNAKDRLGDDIQWSMWGYNEGMLSGARLILPEGGLKAGEPLVVEYRLANVSTETKTIQSSLGSGRLLASLSSGNRFGGHALDQQEPPVTSTLKPGDIFVDTEHRVSIDTTGLQPGEYQVALYCGFICTSKAGKYRIHHRGSIPVTLYGNQTFTMRELPKSDIHWGTPVAGLQFGARWFKHPGTYANGDLVEADLFVANATDQPVEVSVQLPHPGAGWLFTVEDKNGSTIMLERSSFRDGISPQRSIHLKLAPGEVAPITGDGIRVSFSPDTEPSTTSLPKARFQIVSSEDKAMLDHSDHTIKGKLVSQGGDYTAIFEVTVRRPDIPALRLELTSTISFTVAGAIADQPKTNASTEKENHLDAITKIDGMVLGELKGVAVTAVFELEEDDIESSANRKTKVVAEVKTTTDVQGRYTIAVPQKYLGNKSLRATFRFEHPGYLTRTIAFCYVDDFRDQEIKNDEPWWMMRQQARRAVKQTVLRKGKWLLGQVLLPDGNPATRALVATQTKYLAYSWKLYDANEYSTSASTSTDAEGRFHLLADNPASMIVSLAGHAPLVIEDLWGKQVNSSESITNKVSLATFRLPKAIRPRGRVTTFDGKPISGAIIVAQRDFAWNEFNMPLSFSLSCATNEQGDFEMPPMPAEDYKFIVRERVVNRAEIDAYNRLASTISSPLILRTGSANVPWPKAVTFSNVIPDQSVTLAERNANPIINFQAVETVTATVQIKFPSGRPDNGLTADVSVFGQFKGERWAGNSQLAGDDGIVRLVVPKGVQNLTIGTGHALHRRSAKEPWQLGAAIHLGTMESDVTGLEVSVTELAKLRVKLIGLPGAATNSSEVRINIQAFYVREGTSENQPGLRRVYLASQFQTGNDVYRALALPNEALILRVNNGVGNDPKVLYEERLELKPGDDQLLTIDLVKKVSAKVDAKPSKSESSHSKSLPAKHKEVAIAFNGGTALFDLDTGNKLGAMARGGPSDVPQFDLFADWNRESQTQLNAQVQKSLRVDDGQWESATAESISAALKQQPDTKPKEQQMLANPDNPTSTWIVQTKQGGVAILKVEFRKDIKTDTSGIVEGFIVRYKLVATAQEINAEIQADEAKANRNAKPDADSESKDAAWTQPG